MGNSSSANTTLDSNTLNLFNQDGSICDANCQKQQTLTQLQNTLENAKANLTNAPSEYQEARKNYLVQLNGSNVYNKTLEGDLKAKVEKIATTLQNNFDNSCQEANTLLSNYQGTHVNLTNVMELLKKYIEENKLLIDEIKNTSSDVITNDRRTYYEDQGLNNLKKYYKWMKYLYFLMAFVYLIIVYFYPNPMTNKLKIIIFIIIIIYPFIINHIFKFLFKLLKKILTFLPKDVYHTLGYVDTDDGFN